VRITPSHKTVGIDPRRTGRTRRAALVLFTLSAILFVGIQSRIAESLPTRNVQELLQSYSDPVKVPPPEQRYLGLGGPAIAALPVVAEPPLRLLAEESGSALYVGEERSPANPLRAPPTSL
jgi:hypothetical protein